MTDSVTSHDLQLVHVGRWVEFEESKQEESQQERRLKLALTALLAINLLAVCGAITLMLLVLYSR